MKRRGLLIVGLGNFGMSFLNSVRHGPFEILAVDHRQEAVDRVAALVPQAVVADATDRSVLERLITGQIDVAVISMGERIDVSILAVLHLKSLGVEEIYVKGASDDHAQILGLIGASRVIHPEREAAVLLAQRLSHPSLREYLPLMGDYAVIEIAAPASFDGRSLAQLHLRNDYEVSVIAMGSPRAPDQLTAPAVDRPITAGDMLVLIGKKDALDRFERAIRKA